ncbi:MAG: heparinase II/III family protein [Paracoccaceae bacterium]
MSHSKGYPGRKDRFLNRLSARRATLGRARTAFAKLPEPRTIGSFAKGRQLLAGNYLFAGYLAEAPGVSIWDVAAPDNAYLSETHGFAWLDDLAAVGDIATRDLAQDWLWGWIDRYSKGGGPGWLPDLTGRRVFRWINHSSLLLRGKDEAATDRFYRSLRQQAMFLSRRWQGAGPGLPRFEALTGLVHAGLFLNGLEHLTEPATKALAGECTRQIDDEGGLPTRNPEDLLAACTLLTWVSSALTDAGITTPDAQMQAIERIAPTLRTLRHSDGSLARFHGGGRGAEGWLDHALAFSGIKKRQPDGLSMGYARLSAGRTSVIIDAAGPPTDQASFGAHASTLAFELTSGRRPLIVNCGSGANFGIEWRRAGRATPSHSTISLDGYSSAMLDDDSPDALHERLIDGPTHVPIEISHAPDGLRFKGGHDGYVPTHGLNHMRTLELTFDGRGMAGEDMLLAVDDTAKRRFEKAMSARNLAGVPFDIRFHLHPEVDATYDLDGNGVAMALKSGEIWVFRHDDTRRLALTPSVYLEKGRLEPRATQQIVLSGKVMDYATRIRWSVAKAQDTAIGVRDLNRDDPVLPLINP